MQDTSTHVAERQRAAALIHRRWDELYMTIMDEHAEFDMRLSEAVEHAIQEIVTGTDDERLVDAVTAVHHQRLRAVSLLNDKFFTAYDLSCSDGGVNDEDERIPEAINGAVRDVLGEYVTPDLMNDPGALMEAVDRLGITVEHRRVADGTESRWCCATCNRHGEWSRETLLGEKLSHRHAASHTVGLGS